MCGVGTGQKVSMQDYALSVTDALLPKVMLGTLDSTGSEHLGSIQNFLLRTQPCIVNNTSNQIVSQSFVHFFCLVVVYCVLQVNILKTYAVL